MCFTSAPRATMMSWTSAGSNSPWEITPGRPVQVGGERARVVERTDVVGDHAAVRADRGVAELDAVDPSAAWP